VQPRIRLARPDVGEEEVDAIRRVLESGVFTNGQETVAFERRFAERHDVAHAVAFANGTVALAAMYIGLGIGPGDEVITPSLTFISSATSVLHVGATPVFADVEPETFNLDPADVARRITSRTKAILAVHYGGQPADMDALRAIADDAGVHLLEDAAEAHGASFRGRAVGGLGRAAMFSFTPTKNITTGEGGMVTTDDDDLAASMRLLRNHGQTALYQHEVVGWNWRITEMQAAMGSVQLGKLDTILKRKQANAEWMAQRLDGLAGLRLPVALPDRQHVYMLYTLLLDRDRDGALHRLNQLGIESRLYFPPAHRQPVFESGGIDLPVTEDLAARLLSIPFHSLLTEEELSVIGDGVEAAVQNAA
jgi:perosamine synthetase